MVMAHPPHLPSSIVRTYGDRAAANYTLHLSIYRSIFEDPFRLEDVLAQGLPMPVQISWGAQDRVLHPGGAAILKQLLPQATVVILPELGHVPQIEAPQKLAAMYLAWRAKLPAASR